jgi:hypothetical protein
MQAVKKGAWQPMSIGWMIVTIFALVFAIFSLINSCHWIPV